MNINLAWRNIWRNKRRTLITLASIAFAVFFSSITRSIQLGTYANMISNSVRFFTGYAQIHKNGYWEEKSLDNSFELTDELSSSLEAIPEVVNLVPRIESFSLVSFQDKTKAAMVLGIKPEDEDMMTSLSDKIVKGNYLTTNDPGVLIGSGLAEYLGVVVGDTLAMIGQGYHGTNAVGKYGIKGIFETPLALFNKGVLYMSLPVSQQFFGNTGMISSLTMNVSDNTNIHKLSRHVRTDLSGDDLEVMTWQEMMPELVQSIELDQSSGKIILYVLYIIIGFGMFGTFLMMAKERTYEFGILISIGMRRLRLQLLVVVEMVLLSLAGVLAGVVISFPLMVYMYYHPIKLTGDFAKVYESFGIEPLLKFSMSPTIFIEQAIVVLVLALIMGVYPIWFVHKLKVAEAIRHK